MRRFFLTTLFLALCALPAAAQQPPAPAATPLPGCFHAVRQPDPKYAPAVLAPAAGDSEGALSDGEHTYSYEWQTDTGWTNLSGPVSVTASPQRRRVVLRVHTGRHYLDGMGYEFPRLANIYERAGGTFRFLRSVSIGRHHESFGQQDFVDVGVAADVSPSAAPHRGPNTTADCALVFNPDGGFVAGMRERLHGIDAGAARTWIFGAEDPNGAPVHFALSGVSDQTRTYGWPVAWFSVLDKNLKSGGQTTQDHRAWGMEVGWNGTPGGYYKKEGVACGKFNEPCDWGFGMSGSKGWTNVSINRAPSSDRSLVVQGLPGGFGYIFSGVDPRTGFPVFDFDNDGNLVLKRNVFVQADAYNSAWATSNAAAPKKAVWDKIQSMMTAGTQPTLPGNSVLGRRPGAAGPPEVITLGDDFVIGDDGVLRLTRPVPEPTPQPTPTPVPVDAVEAVLTGVSQNTPRGEWTTFTFNQAIKNLGGSYDPDFPTRLTVRPGDGGTFVTLYSLMWDYAHAGFRYARVLKNGVTPLCESQSQPSVSGFYTHSPPPCTLTLSDGDYLELQRQHTSTALYLYVFGGEKLSFSMRRVK